MIDFSWPLLFFILPLPLLLRWLLPPASTRDEAAIRIPFFKAITTRKAKHTISKQLRWPYFLALLSWLLLVAAAANPQWMGDPIELPISGRDLMLAVDLSGSMDVKDFKINGQMVNRLVATQWVGGQFIDRRIGDRIGLILFGRQAYVQTPLTFDRVTVRILLEEAIIGLAGKETAIGDAIGLAVKRMKENSHLVDDAANTNVKISSVLILLTDGANTAGKVSPLKAAELAHQYGLKIYTIGIGADEMIVRSLFGNRRVNPSTDLDEKTLKEIAKITGGQYFRARDVADLEKIYQILDEMEPIEQETQVFRPSKALYVWPLGVALALSALLLLLLSSRTRLSR